MTYLLDNQTVSALLLTSKFMDAYTRLKLKISHLQTNNDRWINRTDIPKTPEFRHELKVRQELLTELTAEIEAIDRQGLTANPSTLGKRLFVSPSQPAENSSDLWKQNS